MRTSNHLDFYILKCKSEARISVNDLFEVSENVLPKLSSLCLVAYIEGMWSNSIRHSLLHYTLSFMTAGSAFLSPLADTILRVRGSFGHTYFSTFCYNLGLLSHYVGNYVGIKGIIDTVKSVLCSTPFASTEVSSI